MTQIRPIKLSESESIAASAAAGYIIAELIDGRSPKPVGGGTDFDQCRDEAAQLADVNCPRTFGVFKLVRKFGPPSKETSKQ